MALEADVNLNGNLSSGGRWKAHGWQNTGHHYVKRLGDNTVYLP